MGEFTVSFDADRLLVDVVVSGMWHSASARRYHAAVVARAPRSGPFDMIIDLRAAAVLPADAASCIERSLADLAGLGLRYAAHITTSALSAMQVRRIGGSHAVMAFFATRAEALDWLAPADSPADQDFSR